MMAVRLGVFGLVAALLASASLPGAAAGGGLSCTLNVQCGVPAGNMQQVRGGVVVLVRSWQVQAHACITVYASARHSLMPFCPRWPPVSVRPSRTASRGGTEHHGHLRGWSVRVLRRVQLCRVLDQRRD